MTQEIKFYTTKGPYGFLSNFYRASFVDEYGTVWMTSEHFYQAQKAIYTQDYLRILSAPNPKEAARIGRSIPYHADWDEIKYECMRNAVGLKFGQNLDIFNKLMRTGDAILIEDTVGTPRPDAVWGNGADGTGKNWLGKILMEYRDASR